MKPRVNHPYTWWTAALVLSIGAAVTSSIWVLALLVMVVIGTVLAFHPDQDSLRAFKGFCYFAVIALGVRMVFALIIGNPFATDVLFTLPELATPTWLGGLTLGGEVTSTALINALLEGLRMAAIVLAVGAASSLTPPVKVLSKLPSAVYEVGLTVLIALNTVPSLAKDISRTQTALKLRGRKHSGLRALATALTPTMESSLRRSMALAAFMESRGYGRLLGEVTLFRRGVVSISTLMVLAFTALSLAALMSAGFQETFGAAALVGLVTAFVILIVASRGMKRRTEYRPVSWGSADLACVALALAATTSIWFLS